jgi:hypothetical protein
MKLDREKAAKACEKRGATITPGGIQGNIVWLKAEDGSLFSVMKVAVEAWIKEDER